MVTLTHENATVSLPSTSKLPVVFCHVPVSLPSTSGLSVVFCQAGSGSVNGDRLSHNIYIVLWAGHSGFGPSAIVHNFVACSERPQKAKSDDKLRPVLLQSVDLSTCSSRLTAVPCSCVLFGRRSIVAPCNICSTNATSLYSRRMTTGRHNNTACASLRCHTGFLSHSTGSTGTCRRLSHRPAASGFQVSCSPVEGQRREEGRARETEREGDLARVSETSQWGNALV